MVIHYSWLCDSNSLKSNLIDNNSDVFFLLGLIHESHYFILGTVSVEESIESTINEMKAALPYGYCIIGAINAGAIGLCCLITRRGGNKVPFCVPFSVRYF